MKYCTHCGAQLPDDAQFCPGCGKAAGDSASPAPARKFPLPVLLAILAVALVAGVFFALTQGGYSPEAPGAPPVRRKHRRRHGFPGAYRATHGLSCPR
ncbi:zinc-ribbon domain-containing protein [Gemmiger formicilis]|uniref:zinc-ribbon domain-containing protein n=1 Tax=Gemmiger formicilis TaxID=745368 RepID=UPI00195DE086|nr:zinc-ribbon domain-containing protein [Gemmiger formicilis]MBM6715802.1 zinc-ribbon domain-containing protein [Gemmiger formicilis]